MCILFHETLSNEWTFQGVCESRVDWSKFEDLSNRDHQGGHKGEVSFQRRGWFQARGNILRKTWGTWGIHRCSENCCSYYLFSCMWRNPGGETGVLGSWGEWPLCPEMKLEHESLRVTVLWMAMMSITGDGVTGTGLTVTLTTVANKTGTWVTAGL